MKRRMLWVVVGLVSLLAVSCKRDAPVVSDNSPKTPAEVQGLHLTGTFLDGTAFDSNNFSGQRLLLGFLSYKHRNALPMVRALAKLKPYEQSNNFKLILVSIDYGNEDGLKKFVADNKIDLPVVLEGPALNIAMQLRVENEVAVYGLSNKHQPFFGMKEYVFPDTPEGEDVFLAQAKEALNIKQQSTSTEPRVGVYPQAPDFTVQTLEGKSIRLSSYKGKIVLLVFFSPLCPHCQDEMRYLNQKIYPEYKSKGLEILALSTAELVGQAYATYQGFKYTWPLADDHLRKVHQLYSKRTAVPETYFIDRDGKIRRAHFGYAATHEDVFTFQIKQLLGLPNPPVLTQNRFSGSDVCSICHEPEAVAWSITPHAQAWSTLEEKGDETNPECVACHSLGANNPKGYLIKKDSRFVAVPPTLDAVQCENCHGLGGPHVAQPQDVTKDPVALNKKCLECHTEKYTLPFNFQDRLKKINHSDAAKIMKMSEAERLALLKKVSKKPSDLFDVSKEYIGVSQCASCHADIVKKWEGSLHAQSFAILKQKGKEMDAACLQCHTVGYGEATGSTAHVGDKNFESVGCESCHGPGSLHAKSSKKTDIQALGEGCDFCVKGQICGSCHDEANSPGFNLMKGLEVVKGNHK